MIRTVKILGNDTVSLGSQNLFYPSSMLPNINSTNVNILYDSSIDTGKDSIKIYFKNDSIFIRNNTTSTLIGIPWQKKEQYPAEKYKGIYIVDDSTIHRLSYKRFNGLVYIGIDDLLGGGQLYVLDFKKKVHYIDTAFNRDYIYGKPGIFILDTDRDRILSISMPIAQDKKNEPISLVTIYSPGGYKYNYLGEIYYPGALAYSDSLIKIFYRKYQKAGGNWKNVN